MKDDKSCNEIIWRKGKKVILRPFEETDAPHFARWINDPKTNQYLVITWPMTIEAEKCWIREAYKPNPDNIKVTICTHDGKIIGNMGMVIDRVKQSAITGSIIGTKEYRGKGYGTDAKMLMLDYAFNWIGLRKVTSTIHSFNGQSKAYAKKCGYRHMATIEKEHFRNGEWVDEEYFVVFREEWLPLWDKYLKETTLD